MDDLRHFAQGVGRQQFDDALAAFWKARPPAKEYLALMPLAPSWWKESGRRVANYAHLPLKEASGLV